MKLCSAEPGSSPHPDAGPCRIVVIGDTVISEQGMATVVARDNRYLVCQQQPELRAGYTLPVQLSPIAPQ